MRRKPISPKFHGAWLGAGAGTLLGNILVNIIQTDVTHGPLSTGWSTLIYGVASAAVAAAGAWLAPLIAGSSASSVAPK